MSRCCAASCARSLAAPPPPRRRCGRYRFITRRRTRRPLRCGRSRPRRACTRPARHPGRPRSTSTCSCSVIAASGVCPAAMRWRLSFEAALAAAAAPSFCSGAPAHDSRAATALCAAPFCAPGQQRPREAERHALVWQPGRRMHELGAMPWSPRAAAGRVVPKPCTMFFFPPSCAIRCLTRTTPLAPLHAACLNLLPVHTGGRPYADGELPPSPARWLAHGRCVACWRGDLGPCARHYCAQWPAQWRVPSLTRMRGFMLYASASRGLL